MANAEQITIEVCYARVDRQLILELHLKPGVTLRQAIESSDILERFPEIDLERNKVGIFGKLKKLDQILEDRDRIEIYRALIADPKAARRRRAAAKVNKQK